MGIGEEARKAGCWETGAAQLTLVRSRELGNLEWAAVDRAGVAPIRLAGGLDATWAEGGLDFQIRRTGPFVDRRWIRGPRGGNM